MACFHSYRDIYELVFHLLDFRKRNHVSAGRKRDGYKQLYVSFEFTKIGKQVISCCAVSNAFDNQYISPLYTHRFSIGSVRLFII